MSDEPKSILKTGEALATQAATEASLEAGQRAEIGVGKVGDALRVEGAVALGKNVDAVGHVEKSKSRGLGWFLGLKFWGR